MRVERTTIAGATAPARIWPELRFYAGLVALFWTCFSLAGALWVIGPSLLSGWSSVVITSDSMAPAFRRGDIVIAKTTRDGALDFGSVVVFEDPARDGLLTHRLVGITPDGDYITRGDANEVTDSTPLAPEAVQGVGQLLVPSVGLPLLWTDEESWLPLTLWAGLTLLALWAARFALDSRYDPWRTERRAAASLRSPVRRVRRVPLPPRWLARALLRLVPGRLAVRRPPLPARSVRAAGLRRDAAASPRSGVVSV